MRVVLRRPDLADLLDLAPAQPLRYGAAEPAVLIRVAMLLRELAWNSAPDQLPPIAAALDRLRSTTAGQGFHATEHDLLTELLQLVEQALAGRRTYDRTH